MLTRRTLATCLAVGAAIPSPCRAQSPPDTFRLGTLVVTATRLPAPRTAVPAAVTVIDGEALRATGIQWAADALRQVPGLSVVRNGSTGALTSVFMRGGESDHVMVLVDGVPANDPGGAIDFSNIATADIERIEVVRGPVSVLYGSDAATGVIQIFTKRRTGRPRLEASLSRGVSRRVGTGAEGSFTSDRVSAGVSGGSAPVDYGLTASYSGSDGAYAFNNAYSNRAFSGRLGVRRSGRTEAVFTGRYTEGVFHFPTDGAGRLIDRNQNRTSESTSFGLVLGHAVSDAVEAKIEMTSRTGDYLLDDGPDGVADTTGAYALRVSDRLVRRGADLRLNIRPAGRSTVTVGAAFERQSAVNETASESSFGPFESTSDNGRSNRSAYVQIVTPARPDLTLTAGGRLDANSRFGTFRTYRIGLNWRPAADLAVRAATGTGFKEPTFFENYAEGFVRGDPSLEPEQTRNLELGVERVLLEQRLTVSATAFSQRFRNLIQFTSTPPSPAGPNYFNVGRAMASGLELELRFAAAAGLSGSLSWDYLRTEVVDGGFGTDPSFTEGSPLLRRPRHRLSVAAGYATPRWHLHATINRVGSRADLDFSDPDDFDGRRTTLPAYATVDLAAGYTLYRAGGRGSLDVVVRADNLLDERYEEVHDFPALRRAIHVGLRAHIDP